MNKKYKIVSATITHPNDGEIIKQNIEYYINNQLETIEIYSVRGVICNEIRYGYTLIEN